MENLVVMRITLVIVILLAVALGIIAGAYWSFPMNVGGVILAVAATIAVTYFSAKAEKRARFEAFYGAIRNFGTPLSFDNYSGAFERNGVRFEINFPQGENDTALKINFFVSGNNQRFIIQHEGLILKLLPDCPHLNTSLLSSDYHLNAKDTDFLLRFVQIPAIREEIYGYPSSFFSKMVITFDAGNFELLWTPKMSEQAEGVYKICKTAIVFYDELKKLR